MPTWPASLPQSPLFGGYRRQEPDLLIRSQVDAGTPKVRKRFTAAAAPAAFPIIVTDAQKATFETFFKDTIASGALSFDLELPDISGLSTVRLTDPPTYVPIGPNSWRIDLEILILP